MKLVEVKKMDDCFDGSMVFEYRFDRQIDETFMKIISRPGRLSYYPEFSRPFFKIFSEKGIQIKGIIGDDNFQVTFPQTRKAELKKAFETRLVLCIKEYAPPS